jgi:AcrR family transcriptional regulator
VEGDGRRLTTQGRERKQQLLECAAELFAERGYAETRVLDIVRAAGVAKGLFYWYFDNKEALFRELVGTTRQSLRRTQGEAIDRSATPLEQLRQGTEASVFFMVENARLYALVRAEGMDQEMAKILRTGAEVHVTDTARLIEAGIDTGEVRADDPTLLALGVIGTVAYYTHFHRTGRIELGAAELAAFVARYVVHSLAADSAVALASERAAGARRGLSASA